MRHIFISVRKYMNESRYPYHGMSVYTLEFAEEFFGFINTIKSYIDNECQVTLEDLKNRFNKSDL